MSLLHLFQLSRPVNGGLLGGGGCCNRAGSAQSHRGIALVVLSPTRGRNRLWPFIESLLGTALPWGNWPSFML